MPTTATRPATDPARFLRRRAAAYRAYFEHMPLALPPQGASMRIHDRYAWGRLAELWTLDCRQYRSHHACRDPERDAGRDVIGCAELADPARTMLGAEQEQWLAQGLAGSSAAMEAARPVHADQRHRPRDARGPPDLDRRLGRLSRGAPATAAGHAPTPACATWWRSAATCTAMSRPTCACVPNDPASPVVASEFVGGSISSRGASLAAMARMRRDNPDVVHARGDQRGYALIEVTPEAMQCEFRATAHPVAADARFHTQARFAVESGQAGVLPA